MNLNEARELVLNLISRDLGSDKFGDLIRLDVPNSRDPAKFLILENKVRVIHRFNGWNIPINHDWFSGSLEKPIINGEEFYWYAFAIPAYSGFKEKHYFICDYNQIRSWVLDFKSPLGEDHRNRRYWRADIVSYTESENELWGIFRWGDESTDELSDENRLILLDNINPLLSISGGKQPVYSTSSEDSENLPSRVTFETTRLVRDSVIVSELKTLYKNRCQICGVAIGYNDIRYSEAHHIRPLGEPHNGSDAKDNIIILCPNHHAEFDRGYIAIDPTSKKILHRDQDNPINGSTLRQAESHKLNTIYLTYHLENIFSQ